MTASRRAYGEPNAAVPFVPFAPDEPDDDLTTCPDCGSRDISYDTELMRPWIAEYQCTGCGNLRRREA